MNGKTITSGRKGGSKMAFETIGIDPAKIEWLNSLGAQEISPPWVCIIPGESAKGSMHYSAEYLRDTPLEQLKAKFPYWIKNRKEG
jgi:ADP-heptose:LPS heptosyltransferase